MATKNKRPTYDVYLTNRLEEVNIGEKVYNHLLAARILTYWPTKHTQQESDGHQIFKANCQAILGAKVGVAVVKNPGLNTAWEIGFMKGCGKPVLGILYEENKGLLHKKIMLRYSFEQIYTMEQLEDLVGTVLKIIQLKWRFY